MKPLVLLLFVGGLLLGAIPASSSQTLETIESSIKAKNYDAALRDIDAMQKQAPAEDSVLQQLRAEVLKVKTSAKPSASPLDLVELKQIFEEAVSASKAAKSDERTRHFNEFLAKSSALLEKHPDQTNVWVMRAAAYLDLNKPKEAWETGKKLKAFNLMESSDAAILEVMAGLRRKGLLKDTLEVTALLSDEQRQFLGSFRAAEFEGSDAVQTPRSGVLNLSVSSAHEVIITGRIECTFNDVRDRKKVLISRGGTASSGEFVNFSDYPKWTFRQGGSASGILLHGKFHNERINKKANKNEPSFTNEAKGVLYFTKDGKPIMTITTQDGITWASIWLKHSPAP